MTETLVHGRTLDDWRRDVPQLAPLLEYRETQWFNPALRPTAEAIGEVGLTRADIEDAAARLRRFAPYLAAVFPDTRATGGILESPLVAVPAMKKVLARGTGGELPGDLWLKLDSELPVSGSIKARGGIYEVLRYAEDLAVQEGMLSLHDDYSVLATPRFTEFFSRHAVTVGSTGNLGLSIGIVSARLGFRVTVHMSADARQWKKDRLRAHGVEVIEYQSDYSQAVKRGRAQAEADPACHFVDDENSRTLFLGYAVAAHRLAGQLQALDIAVDHDHPLFVHLPCGVGGGPGGVAFGLKTEFGDDVHVIFSEPTHCPSMFLGVCTGLHEGVSVRDFGIDNVTAADGLACGRPSGFVGRAMQHLVDGYMTVGDDRLHRLLAQLHDAEHIDVEPSGLAGLVGIQRIHADSEYLRRIGMDRPRLDHATHIAWATGGSMVPREAMDAYIAKGHALLEGQD